MNENPNNDNYQELGLLADLPIPNPGSDYCFAHKQARTAIAALGEAIQLMIKQEVANPSANTSICQAVIKAHYLVIDAVKNLPSVKVKDDE